MLQLLNDDTHLKRWFGCFATRLDQAAERDLAQPLTSDETCDRKTFVYELSTSDGLVRDASCRMAYQDDGMQLFVNGCEWDITGVSLELVRYVANHRTLYRDDLLAFLPNDDNQIFLYELWRLQWLQFESNE